MLRQDDDITDAECASILERINRIGAKAHIADLSLRILTWIDKCPDRRARDLADEIGMDTRKLKTYVRKLKEMGLTESRQIGYRLSARGQRVLDVARKNSAS
ncbi:hypothetical protein A33O_20710 [Nitratireductor aquibiodomus RA22]|uniref:HTH marR-type domain-containing protein n=1 Tax=Nitratireductor aquibiodomus RA22 TaxID=1189611 RepID=I5BRN6_9HYPH|nr:hypothetical protein A33O_20710 [Nitratireductor aquibiodomus RA22]